MGLNPFLQANGIEAIETDLGELIIQLAGETPSHIIAPAIHKDRAEIADLFRKHFPHLPVDTDIAALTALARRVINGIHLRKEPIHLRKCHFLAKESGQYFSRSNRLCALFLF